MMTDQYYYYYYYYYTCLKAGIPGQARKPVQGRQTILSFTAARRDGDGGSDKGKSETYANHLHLAANHHQHTNSQLFSDLR